MWITKRDRVQRHKYVIINHLNVMATQHSPTSLYACAQPFTLLCRHTRSLLVTHISITHYRDCCTACCMGLEFKTTHSPGYAITGELSMAETIRVIGCAHAYRFWPKRGDALCDRCFQMVYNRNGFNFFLIFPLSRFHCLSLTRS